MLDEVGGGFHDAPRRLFVPVVPPRPLRCHVPSLEIRLDAPPPTPCRVAMPATARQSKPHHVPLLVAVEMRGYLANSPRELTVPVEANQR